MTAKLLQAAAPKTFALILDVVANLTDFARRQRLAASRFTAIDAFSDVAVGYFQCGPEGLQADRDSRADREALTLAGDITLDERGERKVHAHVIVGKGMERLTVDTCSKRSSGRRSRS